jgi:hypothetical protein
MLNRTITSTFLATVFFSASILAQDQGMVTRKITKTDRFDFGVGGTVAITGAPLGNITLMASSANEIEITAEIELKAPSEADLDQLAAVTTFVTEEAPGRTGIISVGTNNKIGDKKQWKKFPKKLMGLPYRIDYVVKVPKYCDLEIAGGKGDLSITGVEGSMRINFLETNAHIDVIAGSVSITAANGTVDVALGTKGWRGRPAMIQLGKGDLTVRLPSNTSASLDAIILRTGKIENQLTDLKQRDRKVGFTDQSIMAKAGVGGPDLKFTVGDGSLKLERLVVGH